MVDGHRVSWAEPGEVPDPEIRKVVGNAGVCHCCCVGSRWLKTSSIVSDFVGRELEQDLAVWFIWSLRCGLIAQQVDGLTGLEDPGWWHSCLLHW